MNFSSCKIRNLNAINKIETIGIMTTTRFKKWWLLLIKGFILIILACLIIFYPQESILTISRFMGISLIITGIVILLISAELRKSMENWTMRLAEGILDIVFGFFLLAHPDISLVTIPIFIGFWVIFYGVLILTGSFQFKESFQTRRKAVLIVGIFTVIIGFIISFNPGVTIVSISILIGVPVLIIGLANLFFAMNLRNLEQGDFKMKDEEGY